MGKTILYRKYELVEIQRSYYFRTNLTFIGSYGSLNYLECFGYFYCK